MPTIQDELLKVRKVLSSKPLHEQIWLYLRDNPDKTAAQVFPLYGKSTYQALHHLELRKMVTSKLEERFTGKTGRKHIKVYRAIGKVYELLPLPAKVKLVPQPVKTLQPAPQPAANPYLVTSPPPPQKKVDDPATAPQTAQQEIDGWPLSKALATWQYLDTKFNSKENHE